MHKIICSNFSKRSQLNGKLFILQQCRRPLSLAPNINLYTNEVDFCVFAIKLSSSHIDMPKIKWKRKKRLMRLKAVWKSEKCFIALISLGNKNNKMIKCKSTACFSYYYFRRSLCTLTKIYIFFCSFLSLHISQG